MKQYPIDLKKLKRYPIGSRKNKVTIGDFAKVPNGTLENSNILHSFPNILMAKDLKEVVSLVAEGKRAKRGILFAIGGHVVKCGLNSILIDLMKQGVITGILMNGATSIHDFEVGMIGETSEDVGAVLGEGEFGMAEETGVLHNRAISQAYENGWGLGYGLGHFMETEQFEFREHSILHQAFLLRIPVFVSVALGDDITHMHPEANGAAIGATSHQDFMSFTSVLPNLAKGGVYFNVGSAVILPEVFLKAFSIVQNLGYDMSGLNTVNMDMQSQYRPLTNVVKRPTMREGKGFHLQGAHEIMVPLLAYGILQELREKP